MKRILVIDDEPVVRALVQACLGSNDCEVACAADGSGALESVSVHRPDLILLDVGLPGVSGPELLRRLRADETTRSIPVLLLTGLEPPEGVEPDGVVLKPFTPSSLRSSLAGWLS
jgi:CheY-like chemotaxis protein